MVRPTSDYRVSVICETSWSKASGGKSKLFQDCTGQLQANASDCNSSAWLVWQKFTRQLSFVVPFCSNCREGHCLPAND